MADETTASVIPLHQVPPEKKARTNAKPSAKTGAKASAKTGAQRAKTGRQRKKDAAADATPPPSSEHLIPLEFSSADAASASHPVPAAHMPQPQHLESAPAPTVASRAVTPPRTRVTSMLLTM